MKNLIFEPYNQITTVMGTLVFTFRLCDMLEKGEIDNITLNQKVIIDGIKIIPDWTPNKISNLVLDIRLSILGMCFIVLDEALNNVYGEKPKKYSDNDIDALRAIIYMLRCAIAHGPVAPRW